MLTVGMPVTTSNVVFFVVCEVEINPKAVPRDTLLFKSHTNSMGLIGDLSPPY